MLYSKVQIFCNNCGKEMFIEYDRVMGREFKVCSSECIKAMQLKRACSIMGQEYLPVKHETKDKDSG